MTTKEDTGGPFDSLDDSKFEELVYELLKELGFCNLSWRKGSGKTGATADQGRDIVASLLQKDIDNEQRLESYFVQCKHYSAGVGPDKLESAFSWANAERPDVLLIVVSNFLSNSCKNWIELYKRNNNPAYKIKIWERKKLEDLLESFPSIKRKFKIGIQQEITRFHNAHARFVTNPGFNSLEYFLSVFDELEAKMRDEILYPSYLSVINPSVREPLNFDERIADLYIGKIDYQTFCKKCRELCKKVTSNFLVQSLMFETLRWAFNYGDKMQSDLAIQKCEQLQIFLKKEIAEEKDGEKKLLLQSIYIDNDKHILELPEQNRRWANHYKHICEKILPKLYLEEDIYLDSLPEH